MRVLLVAAALAVVALAGCSDDPPSGEVSGSPAAVPVEGTAESEFVAFSAAVADPSGGQNPAYNPCPFDGQDDPTGTLPMCTRPSSNIKVHMMSLPDPGTNSYQAFLVDSTGANIAMDLGLLENNGTPENPMYEVVYDNSDDCSTATSNDGCKLDEMYDTIEVRLAAANPVPVATGGLSGSFEAHPDLGGVSFTVDYSGKDATVTLSGTNANLTYQFILYEADAEGNPVAADTFPVSAGENEVTAADNLGDYLQAHIHVSGTKVNVATAGFQ